MPAVSDSRRQRAYSADDVHPYDYVLLFLEQNQWHSVLAHCTLQSAIDLQGT